MSDTSNEEYVRRRWEHVEISNSRSYLTDPERWRFFTSNALYSLPLFSTRAQLWFAGREFTEAREEEIRQVDAEVEHILFELRELRGEFVLYQHAQMVIDICRWSRILARTQAHLAELKRGWK